MSILITYLKKIIEIWAFFPSTLLYLWYTHRLKNVSFFQYSELVKYPYPKPKFFISVFLYGNYKAVARLSNKKFNFTTDYLEHGTDYVFNIDSVERMGYINRHFIKNVYTFSAKRKAIIEQYLSIKQIKRNVYPVGPYIMGVDNFLNKKALIETKEQYGKILTVFPSHSLDYVHSKFDSNILIDEILKYKKDYNSIWICFYWSDIKKGLHKAYEAQGFTIVTAGHNSDPLFLNRLKDIIELSDLTMSNNVGTQIGYSICLNRPHYMFSQPLEYEMKESRFTKNETKNIDKSEVNKKFHAVFGTYLTFITAEQVALVEEDWGKW